MKKTALSLFACLAIAGTTFAGHEMVSSKDSKGYTAAEQPRCFKDNEFTLDVFGSYNDARGKGQRVYKDGFGGGLGLNYFFARYFGVGADANWWEGGRDGNAVIHQLSGTLFLRYPLEMGHLCLAPYAFGGGGCALDGEHVPTGHAGAGLEWRATERFGVFTDGRYVFTGKGNNDVVTYRLGVRFAF
jgi:hypothetical protein